MRIGQHIVRSKERSPDLLRLPYATDRQEQHGLDGKPTHLEGETTK